ncbi:MAG: hypothetical protein CMJ31_08080 [Phycisphaerae bacterium]|nr:hypothetical protein [Phycisphaerae bacterium]
MIRTIATMAIAATAGLASGQTTFTSVLDGIQSGSGSAASGTATLTLNEAQTRLEIFLNITGLDFDGNQTPGTNADNITALHIHRAPAGSNGGVVFGFISPNHDLNGDLVIDPVAGTLFSAWDLTEGNNTTLAAELPNLFADGLYFNVHTVAFGGGEIRGQIVPAPATGAILAGAGFLAARRRRA